MMRGGGGDAGEGGGAVKTIEDELWHPIALAEKVRKALGEADSFRAECSDVGKVADRLGQMLRSAARFVTSSSSNLYERPVRRVAAEASKGLDRALALVRRCKRRSGLLRRVVTITTGSTDFRKAVSLLDASVGDMKWLISVYSSATGGGGIVLSLPPIASTDPILSWVWGYVAVVQMGGGASSAADRAEAAYALANLALDNDRNKKIIMEEGGVPPLLALLKDGGVSIEAQAAAATALANLADNQERVLEIVAELAVPTIVKVLSDSPMRLQVRVAALVARMALNDPVAREEFSAENAIRPLVTLLSSEVPLDDTKPHSGGATSIHSLVQINSRHHQLGGTTPHTNSYYHSEGSGRGGFSAQREREKENESPEVKLQLKTVCAEALCRLSAGSVSNSRKITETKGLLCLSKIIEREKGELQLNCLRTVMEIAAAAESDTDLRRSAFKTNSPAAKSVVEQLLRVLQEENSPTLQIPAIKAIGSLARTFSASETRVIRPLVVKLSHWNPEVGVEAAMALGKFACPENFLHVEHSKAIIEFGGVPPLMRLLKSSEKAQLNGYILLCYLALHVGYSKDLQSAKALPTLELASDNALGQHPSLREVLQKAIYHLELYHAGAHSGRQSRAQ